MTCAHRWMRGEPASSPCTRIRRSSRTWTSPTTCVSRVRPWTPSAPGWTELGIARLDLAAYARDLPLPTLRIIDLARALAHEPDVLLMDETTAALPADLTERVLEVVGRQRVSGRSVIFISHRLIEISALCDRATVLRDGETVGVVDMGPGAEDRIVGLMLGPAEDDEFGGCRQSPSCHAPRWTACRSTRAPVRPGTACRHPAQRCLVRAANRRGAGRRGARGAGPGRAVRGPCGVPSPGRR